MIDKRIADIMNIEAEVSDLLYRMKEEGIIAQANYTFDEKGNVIRISITVLGYCD